MNMAELIGSLLYILAVPFFGAAVSGCCGFPDVYTRLHALTKADNLGLGLVVAGSILLTDDWTVALKLFSSGWPY